MDSRGAGIVRADEYAPMLCLPGGLPGSSRSESDLTGRVYEMGDRFILSRLPAWASFSIIWPGAHIGRFTKRRLSKARRRFARSLCRFGDRAYRHVGNLAGAETEANFKTW